MRARAVPDDARLSLCVAAVGVGAVGAFLVVPGGSPWQMIAYVVPLVLCSVVLTWRVVLAPAWARRPLQLLLACQLAYFALSIPWYFGPVAFGYSIPFPSLLDVFYFGVYAGYAVFLGLVLRRRARDSSLEARVALTDSLILTAAMSAAVWVTVIGPNLDSGTSRLTTTVAVLYPTLTLLLFALAVRLATTVGFLRSAAGMLLLIWIGCEVVGNLFYGYQSVNGTFHVTAPLTGVWLMSYTALGALAAHPGFVTLLDHRAAGDRSPERIRATAHLMRLGVLAVAALVPIACIALTDERPLVLFAVASLTFVLALYRAALLARAVEQQGRELERLAFLDPVTGRGNRAFLLDQAETGTTASETTALLLLDLDGFKQVNDTLGHAAGDELLLEVGNRLSSCIRTDDTVVRLGGDEFALLLPHVGPRAAHLTAERILAQLRTPFTISGMTARVSGSVGIAFGRSEGDLDEMLRDADLAMYEAKAQGGSSAVTFQPEMYDHAAHRLHVDTKLRTAFGDNEFSVSYQPILQALTGEVLYVEAFVRWHHPERGVVHPSEFLPAAADSGLIVELGRLVLRSACEQLALWRADWPELAVAVNVSHRELLEPGFSRHVEKALRAAGLPGSALHLEIAESLFAADDDIISAINSLAELGVRFAIDDFGMGQSSLTRLRDLPVQRIKVHQSFVWEISSDPTAPVLSSIINLAHSLGLIVVAEGVETVQQAAFLVENGCDELQGYLFSHPVAVSQLRSLLVSRMSRIDGSWRIAEAAGESAHGWGSTT